VSTPQKIDLSDLIAQMRLGRFHIVVVALCLLTLFVDGMDFATILVTAPAIIRSWHIEQSAMGIVFGAGNFGLVVGAVLFGFMGDRYGRRPAIITSVLMFSVPAIAAGFATGVDGMLVLRFLTAMGIGGGLPNAIALLTESAPQKYRSSLVIIALIGTALGAAAAGGLAAAVIQPIGWPAVFVIVGFGGLLVSTVLYFSLSESIPFLVLAEPNSPRLRRLVNAAAPRIALEPGTQFVSSERRKKERMRFGLLFQGSLRTATPLLWAAFFSEGLTFTALVSWTPVLLVNGGVSPTDASLAFASSAIAGVGVRLLIARFLDRYGAFAVLGSVVVAIIAFLYLAAFDLSPAAKIGGIILATAFVQGGHDGLNSIVGSFYPTGIRANGVGWVAGMARSAAIIGPIAIGYMLSTKLAFGTTMYVLGAPYLLVMLFCLMLGRRGPAGDETGPIGRAALMERTR
jgi:AAHS family 4-hydroxybenzoate transporter-like MFS transporter